MAATDARPVPIKNAALRVVFPIYDVSGDLVPDAAGLDSEISKDQAAFTDCANEATQIATSSGMYYLDLTASEMNADCVAILVKTSTTDAKTTVLVLYPQEIGDIKVELQSTTAGAIATIWDYLTSLIVTPGSIGEFILGLTPSTGGGANPVTITAEDQDNNPLENVHIRVTEGATSPVLVTNADGETDPPFDLDNATYSVVATKAGYQHTALFSITVSGTANFTLTMTEIVIPPPSDPDFCTVAGTLLDSSGDPLNAKTVTFTRQGNVPAAANGNILAQVEVSAVTDSNGRFEIELVRTDAITPSGQFYNVSSDGLVIFNGPIRLASSTLDLGTLIV